MEVMDLSSVARAESTQSGWVCAIGAVWILGTLCSAREAKNRLTVASRERVRPLIRVSRELSFSVSLGDERVPREGQLALRLEREGVRAFLLQSTVGSHEV